MTALNVNQYTCESKQLMKFNEHLRYVKNSDIKKNELIKHCWKENHSFDWDQKKDVYRESKLILRKKLYTF